MAERVFIHIGLPKTGTTYLQEILWGNREALRADGVSLPGRNHREHLWAALDLRESRGLKRRHQRAPGTWERLAAEIDETPGTALLTHEFFCGATAEQAQTAIERLAPAEVSIIITARHAAAMLTAGWQEHVKNGGVATVAEVAGNDNGDANFGWQTWDLGEVLARWGAAVPPERTHILPLPPSDAADTHWTNFAGVLGVAGDYPLPSQAANRSLGVVQVELLRRVNTHLSDFRGPTDRGVWIRGFLAEKRLARQHSDRLGIGDALTDECRRRSEAAVELVRDRGHRVVGDLDSLLVPEDLPAGREPSMVEDSELVDAAASLAADLLADVRRLKRQHGAGQRTLGSRVRRRVQRATGQLNQRRQGRR